MCVLRCLHLFQSVFTVVLLGFWCFELCTPPLPAPPNQSRYRQLRHVTLSLSSRMSTCICCCHSLPQDSPRTTDLDVGLEKVPQNNPRSLQVSQLARGEHVDHVTVGRAHLRLVNGAPNRHLLRRTTTKMGPFAKIKRLNY